MPLHLEAAFRLKPGGQGLGDVAAVKVFHLAALLADDMMVMRAGLRLLALVAVVALTELDTTRQSQLHKKVREAVHGYQIDLFVRAALFHRRVVDSGVHLLNRQWLFSAREQFYQRPARPGESVSLFFKRG